MALDIRKIMSSSVLEGRFSAPVSLGQDAIPALVTTGQCLSHRAAHDDDLVVFLAERFKGEITGNDSTAQVIRINKILVDEAFTSLTLMLEFSPCERVNVSLKSFRGVMSQIGPSRRAPTSRPPTTFDSRLFMGAQIPAPIPTHRKTHTTDVSRALNPSTMSGSTFRLTDLPVEILEQILIHLPDQDIVKVEVVRRIVVIPHDCVDEWLSAAWCRLVDNSRT